MLQHFLPGISSYSAQSDQLFDLITYVMGFWFFLGQGLFFYFILKYRRKPGVPSVYISGDSKQEKKPIAWAHKLLLVCDIVIVLAAVKVWYHVKQELPPADATIKVIGQQWAWTFVDAGKDGKLDTPDDITTIDELHVQVNKTYHFLLTTKDVLHSFFVPVFRLKQDAVPGREIVGWFKALETGEYDITCAEICGVGHGLMGGRIFIESEEDHQKWVDNHSSQGSAKLGLNP
ncbi:cytochrome c oxidase subunit II [bacterium]|nr:cytochrome c oxidase subunit II [bacterium]